MATQAPARRVAVTGRIDYTDTKTSRQIDLTREPLKARVRTVNGSAAGPSTVRARVSPANIARAPSAEPEPRFATLPKSVSSSTITASSFNADTKGKRTRTRSADPETSLAGSWQAVAPPPVPPIPVVHQRKVHAPMTDSPRSLSPPRKASSTPSSVHSGVSTPDSPPHARGRGYTANIGISTSSDSAPSSAVTRPVSPQRHLTSPALTRPTQSVTANVTVRHQRSQSSNASLLSNSISSTSQSPAERYEQEKEAWLAAKREEDEERDARTKRKIMDLEITNASLLAINSTLERNKLKQTAEIRSLRHNLQSGLPLATPGLLPSPGISDRGMLGDVQLEKDDDWETILAEDPAYASVLASIDELIKQAQRACASVAEKRDAPKVLQPQLLEPPDTDLGPSSDEEDMSASLASLKVVKP